MDKLMVECHKTILNLKITFIKLIREAGLLTVLGVWLLKNVICKSTYFNDFTRQLINDVWNDFQFIHSLRKKSEIMYS